MRAALASFLAGLRGLFQKRAVDREMDEELRGFVAAATQEGIHRGLAPEDAARQARATMGSLESVKEGIRESSWETTIEGLGQDIRFGLRLLRRHRGFAATAILSLSLGIGANTAIFELLDAVRMRTLPVKDPGEIARIQIDQRKSASGNFSTRYSDLTSGQWQGIKDQQQAFSSLFAWSPNLFNVSPGGEVHNVQGLWVSGSFFETLGIRPALGRLYSAEEDRPECASPGAVLSHAYWKRAYGGSPSIIGRTLTVNRHPFEIVGVTPADFFGVEVGRSFDVVLPLCAEALAEGEASQRLRPDGWWLAAMGRLKPGWTMAKATAHLRAISPGIFESTIPPSFSPFQTKTYRSYKLAALPGESGASQLRASFENPLWFLLGLAALVLLLASANLANLMLARSAAREKEMAMRLAVGASRGRLVRQLLIESLLVAAIGAVFGAILAKGLSQVMIASLSTSSDPLFMDIATDWRVLAFTAGLACLSCLLFGLTPALKATADAPTAAFKESARGVTEGRDRLGLRRLLVVTQIALSLMLLVGALLFARSLSNLAALDAGFRQDGILAADFDYSSLNLAADRRVAFGNSLLERVRAIPGVEAAASAEIIPLSGNGTNHGVLMGDTGDPDGDAPTACYDLVSPGFFRTLETPLLAGRDFDDHDTQQSLPVAIVNEAFARTYVGGKNPVGQTFRIKRMRETSLPLHIIGLVKDTKYLALREDAQAIVYTPRAQYDRLAADTPILIRSNATLGVLLPEVLRAAKDVAPDLDITFFPLRGMIQESLLRDRLMAVLSGFFGFLAAVLAAIGLYGVVSYMVERRRTEIGIRMALGAGRPGIFRLVLGETLVLLVAGVLVGVFLALAASRMAASMLFGLKPNDPPTYLLATVLLSVVALMATLLPARRAARLDPMVALRDA